jgi:glycosyltransferase involved in cell wall biosynthesis
LRFDALALWWLQRRAELLLVCSDEERRRIQTFVPEARVRVIPHFVEDRPLSTPRPTAKEALGLGGRRVVTLLGYVHPRKGHELLIDALPSLPADVTVVFAGTTEAVHLPYVAHLREKAVAAGVAGRLRITGFLPEPELDLYLAATDLAVCPFTTVAASGSVSTWLSAGTPILAADLPLISEYNIMEPGAIRTFSPYTANALAEAACNLLAAGAGHDDMRAQRLRARLRMDSVLQQHIEAYRGVAEKRAAQGSGA